MKQWINGYKNTITPMHTFISVICVQQKAPTENEAADANRRKIQVKLGSGSTICFHSYIRDDHLHTHCDIAAYIFATIHHYHQQHRGAASGENKRNAPRNSKRMWARWLWLNGPIIICVQHTTRLPFSFRLCSVCVYAIITRHKYSILPQLCVYHPM